LRLTASVPTSLNQWFGDFSIKTILAGLGVLKESPVILNADANIVTECLKALEDIADANTRLILQDVISRLLVSNNEPFTKADLRIGHVSQAGLTFDEYAALPAVHKVIAERKRDAAPEESRDSIFYRCFEPLARYSKEIIIGDEYAALAITETRRGEPLWLLEHLMQITSADIRIYSVPPAWKVRERGNTRQDPAVEYLKETLTNALTSLKKSQPNYTGKITISLNRAVYHNRRINFVYDRGSLALNLEKGIQTFQFERRPDSHSFATNDSEGYFATRIKRTEEQKPVLRLTI